MLPRWRSRIGLYLGFLVLSCVHSDTNRAAKPEGNTAQDENSSVSNPGVIEVARADSYSARAGSYESQLRPQVLSWARQFRPVALPLLEALEQAKREDGFGENNCALLSQGLTVLATLPPPPDETFSYVIQPLEQQLPQMVHLCEVWDPGPLAGELFFMVGLLEQMELDFKLLYGLRALPELGKIGVGGGGSAEPLETPAGEVRIRIRVSP